MDLEVGPGVLIPRPETEVLVEAVVDRLRQANWPCPVVVDLGTGSGNVALAIAREVPWAQVWATDLSPRAVWVARRNAQRWAPQVKVLPPGDLAQPLRRRSIRAHVAVMNPPYIPTRHLSRLAREVRREPRLALDGGPDGLSVVRRLVASVAAGEVLVPGGELWMEIGFDQAQRVEEILTTQLGGPVIWHRDLAGILRVVGVRWQPLPGRGHP
jgi:release factor glutamine methyltransferase